MPNIRKAYLPLALLILLAAVILRLAGLNLYPPGPHYDEGANIIIARSVAFGGAGLHFFPIVPNYQGREILYYYLSTPLLYIIPDSDLALRVTSALLGILTVAATMGLGRAMFRGQRGTVIGLTMGVSAALSFPLIFLSRQGFRAVTLPFCQSLALLFLWRGLTARRHNWRWLAAGGFMGGAALYTYMASRLFPFWLGLGGLILLVLDRANWRRRLQEGTIFFGVMALTALPMGIYALQNPDIFMGRLAEVTTYGEDPITLGESVIKHLRMFFIEGESLLRYNIPERPYLTLPEGLLMLAGMGVAGWQLLRRHGSPRHRSALAFALLAPLMVIPSVIALGGFPPNHMRSVGMVPLIFVLVALGFEAIASQLAARFRPLTVARLTVIAVLLTVLGGGFLMGRTYFTWASRADLYFDTHNDLAAAKDWLKTAVGQATRVYFTSEHFGHPTVTSDPAVPPLLWQRSNILYWPPPDQDGVYIYRRDTNDVPAAWLDGLAPFAVDGLALAPDGLPAFNAFHVPAGTPPPIRPVDPAAVVSTPALALAGVETPPLTAGEPGALTMAWRVLQPPAENTLMPLVQIEDEIGTVLARQAIELVETARWLTGETVILHVGLTLPAGTPPGDYLIRVAWVDRIPDQYIAYMDDTGRQGQVWATIGQISVTRPAAFPGAESLLIPTPYDGDPVGGAALLGWNLPATLVLAPGESIRGTLFWQAGAVPIPDMEYAISLTSPQTTLVLWEGRPVRGTHPTPDWRPAELVTDHGLWTVPRETANGTYALSLTTPETTVHLADIEVQGIPHLFDRPTSARDAGILFGGGLLLDGYTQIADDSTLTLEIIWQGYEPVAQDYTVFVHVVDEAGQIVAQRDMMPRANGYPTSRWVPEEYIQDIYTFSGLPSGTYTVRMGLYLQSDGTRLLTPEGADFIWLDPVEVG